MIVDYKNFFRIFLCKDIDELKERLAFLALENRESKGYYEVGDSWIENEKLKKKALEKVLRLQEEVLEHFSDLKESIEQYESCYKAYRDKWMGDWVVTCLVDFLSTKKVFEHAVEVYINYPERNEETEKDEPPYSDEYIKKWLKKDFIQSKYKG